MKKVLLFCALLFLWLSLDGSSVWAQDVGWMQKGVRVWYFGSAGAGTSSNAVEAYLFASINGTTAQLTHHSAIDYWSSPKPQETETGSIVGKGPIWIHPQVLQNIKIGDTWRGIKITWMDRDIYTYDTFKSVDEFSSLPYLLLPIKELFRLRNQREIVKLVYGRQYLDDVWGTAYFDAETGLCLFNLRIALFGDLVWFILSEINYDFANQTAFAEDNGPHTGFRSNIVKTNNSTSQYVKITSSVETRYGDTVQMWVSTSAGGSLGRSYMPPNENYCFFGDIPVLRRKYMTATPQYPPEGWNEYGEYLWWWVPQEALASSTINIFDVPMTRTSTAPYTFSAAGVGTSLYFPNIIFDNDGYMTDFTAKYSAIGLDLGFGSSASGLNIDLDASASSSVPIHLVDGLEYFKNTMGRATPVPPAPGAATLISPSGTVTTPTPTYTWNAVATATEYDLRVNDSKGNRILQWYSASEAGCASGTGTCSVTPPTPLAAGPGKWWIQTKNSGGTGPLSSPMSFMVEGVSAPGIPEGPKNVEKNTSYAYTVRGSTSNVGDSVQYFFDWGDGTNSNWLPAGTMIASHSWATAGTYLIKAQARCATHNSMVSSWSKTLSVIVEMVSTPRTPSGLASGMAGVSSVYSTGDSTSDLRHSIQYLFDWGDGTNSGWLPIKKNSASKSWALPGSYNVRAKARCSTHNLVISDWSGALDVSMEKLTVLKPNGGEIVPSGGSYIIEWTAFSQAEKFNILYSMDNGSTWKLIANDVVGTSHDWNPVPVVPGNKNSCLVKVIGYRASNVKVAEDKSDKPFAIGVVRLVSPNGGEVLKTGDSYTIKWEINGTKSEVTKVNLYYTTNGGASYALINLTPLDGASRAYDWTVPTPTANMGNCYVKVVAYSGSTVVGTDTSDKPFTIEGVKLTQPNGGEVLKTGDPYTIKWEINGTKSDVTKVNLYYTTNGGASYALINPTPLDGASITYDWTVPTPPANMGNCYVKVVAYSGSTVVGSDRSDKPFEIAAVKLLSPNEGYALESGDPYTIEWEIYGTKSPVTTQKLYYSMDGGATWSLISALDGASRSYDWTVPVPTSNKNSCYVKVVGYSGSNVKAGEDKSDKPFAIEVVKLLTPNGGEALESGSSYPIQWEINGTQYPVATQKLYWSMDGGATWSLITTLDGSFRNYDWIPLVQITKTKCKVKVAISDTKGITTANDMSDGYFTIAP